MEIFHNLIPKDTMAGLFGTLLILPFTAQLDPMRRKCYRLVTIALFFRRTQ